MGRGNYKQVIDRLIRLHQERDAVRQFRTLAFDLKASVEAYYNHEIEALLRDPYICDKWNGLQEGGIAGKMFTAKEIAKTLADKVWNLNEVSE